MLLLALFWTLVDSMQRKIAMVKLTLPSRANWGKILPVILGIVFICVRPTVRTTLRTIAVAMTVCVSKQFHSETS
jgi:hypothetical protein